MEESSEIYVHAIPQAGRLLPSAGRWNSIEVNFGLLPKSSQLSDLTTSKYSKSFDFNLKISDKTHLKRFIYASISLVLIIIAIALLISLLPHKHGDTGSSTHLTLALNHALTFFDAQKSGVLPKNNSVKFRGDSGLKDGESGEIHAKLVGGFYDSGNNVKFSFPTAYTITLLSWTVIEYRQKYVAIDQLDHVEDIIKWGSDYLLRLFVPSNSTSKPALLYSQVGSTNDKANTENDITCWQRPEDMTYTRPISVCGSSAADLSGEIIAALAAASLVFNQDLAYSKDLIQASESLFELVTKNQKNETYTATDACGKEARNFYNSTGYLDELVWGGTWLFFATGNVSYLKYATENFKLAAEAEPNSDNGVFYWNNKLAANTVLLTRLRYLLDPGYPYEETLRVCSDMATMLMCSYISPAKTFSMTPGGLILLRPNNTAPLQFAATAAFLSKLYSDYLDLMQVPGGSCGVNSFSLEMLRSFAESQVDYILGHNPLKLSYLVGFGDNFPKQVHHRSASIPWDGRNYNCADGKRWQDSKDPNPNVLLGAMVAGPDENDKFLDQRDRPEYTEPTISGNAGLVAALIALLDIDIDGGMDREGIFANILPSTFQ